MSEPSQQRPQARDEGVPPARPASKAPSGLRVWFGGERKTNLPLPTVAVSTRGRVPGWSGAGGARSRAEQCLRRR